MVEDSARSLAMIRSIACSGLDFGAPAKSGMDARLALGYAIAMMTIDALERSSADAQLTEGHANPGIIGLMARWRWFWIPPLYALALLFLLIVALTRGTSTAQFMYNKF
jgi:hypothetical protein